MVQKAKTSKNTVISVISIVIFLILLSAFLIGMYSTTVKEAEVTVTDGILSIKGMYGEEYDISGITDITLKESLPVITRKTNGAGLGDIKKGDYDTKELGVCRLQIHDEKNPPYIYINTDKGMLIINFNDSGKTISTYEFLSSHIK